jgi:hypothetical protein
MIRVILSIIFSIDGLVPTWLGRPRMSSNHPFHGSEPARMSAINNNGNNRDNNNNNNNNYSNNSNNNNDTRNENIVLVPDTPPPRPSTEPSISMAGRSDKSPTSSQTAATSPFFPKPAQVDSIPDLFHELMM